MICKRCQIKMIEVRDLNHIGYGCPCCEYQCDTRNGEIFAESQPLEDHIQAELDRIFNQPYQFRRKAVKIVVAIVLIIAFVFV